MKRIIAIAAALLLAVMMLTAAGCSADMGGYKLDTPSFTGEDIALVCEDLTVRPGDPVAALLEKLGSEYELTEVTNEGSGEDEEAAGSVDKMFDYGTVFIMTTDGSEAGEDCVRSIEAYTAGWETTRGITVGSKMSDVKAAYGETEIDDGGTLTYYADPENAMSDQLYFTFNDDTVVCIGFIAAQ